MKKSFKRLSALLLLLLAMQSVVLSGCGAKTADAGKSEEYPKIVYIDNVSYYGTDEVCQMVPRKAPDGIIETFVDSAIMPDAYNSANFGAEQGQLEYMFTDDGQLIVHIGEDWYYFK